MKMYGNILQINKITIKILLTRATKYFKYDPIGGIYIRLSSLLIAKTEEVSGNQAVENYKEVSVGKGYQHIVKVVNDIFIKVSSHRVVDNYVI